MKWSIIFELAIEVHKTYLVYHCKHDGLGDTILDILAHYTHVGLNQIADRFYLSLELGVH